MKSVLISAAPYGRTRIDYLDSADHTNWPARNPSLCLHNETIEYNLSHWLTKAQIKILPQEEILWENE